MEQATSGEAALSRLAEETLDLLIIDVRMPGTSGLEVTRSFMRNILRCQSS